MRIALFWFFLFSTSVFAESPRLISVNGSAEQSFEPDKAYVTINLWGKGKGAKMAQGLAVSQYDILKKALTSMDIKPVDLQTIGYELNPDFKYDDKTQANLVVGFVATQTIRVTLRKIQMVGKFLDELNSDSKNIKAGTNVQSVTWDLEKRAEIEKTLLVLAVKAASAEAQMLAGAAGVKIKNLFHLAPQGASLPIPQYEADAAPMLKSMRGGEAKTSTVFAGEVKVVASVGAQYEIE